MLSGLARADLSDTFPPGVTETLRPLVWGLREALTFLHHPAPDVALATLEDRSHPAWQRLKAEELLAQQLSQLQSKRERAALRSPALARQAAGPARAVAGGVAVPADGGPAARGRGDRPRPGARLFPMHRLLQGDVGSGKTVVAALAAAIAIDAGWQCALMAPTEILAEQHFRKLIGWLEPLFAPRGLRVAWLTGSQKKKERAEMLALVASGEAALVVGTHAVIQEQVQFRNLGLAIIDEQHRFGVAQRLALRGKDAGGRAGAAPADDVGHAHPAHAGHELLRGPGRFHHRRVAAGPHARRHQADCGQPARRGDRTHPRPGGRRAARCTGSAR